jgi:hypothetical protein
LELFGVWHTKVRPAASVAFAPLMGHCVPTTGGAVLLGLGRMCCSVLVVLDHVVIGPPGVFTINTKRHPGGNVDVKGRGCRDRARAVREHRSGRSKRLT